MSQNDTDQSDDLHLRTHGELKRRLAQNLGTDKTRYSEEIGNERHKRVTREEIDRICDELGLGFLEEESKLQKQSSIMLKLGRDHRTEVRSWDSSDLRAVIERLEEVNSA